MRGATGLYASHALPNKFQSTHPVRGATLRVGHARCRVVISIHAPREGCDLISPITLHCSATISIHAPREGCDWRLRDVVARVLISIHAPREGCDVLISDPPTPSVRFQSTHPVRGATARMDFISQNMDTPPIPRHQLYCTIHPHFPRYANPLNRYASRSLTLELSNDKKNTHRPQKP